MGLGYGSLYVIKKALAITIATSLIVLVFIYNIYQTLLCPLEWDGHRQLDVIGIVAIIIVITITYICDDDCIKNLRKITKLKKRNRL